MVILASCLLFSCNPKKEVNAVSRELARVIFVEGEVLVSGKPAVLDMVVGDNETIVTGAASQVEIMFADKNIFRIGANSQASIDFSKEVAEVNLKKGSISAFLKKLKQLAGQDSFIIKTASAQAGVRGTALCVWSDGKDAYVCCCNGTVRTIDAKGLNEQTLVASHHMARLYKSDSSGITIEEAGMLFHTDETLESLAAKIDEEIDWSKAN